MKMKNENEKMGEKIAEHIVTLSQRSATRPFGTECDCRTGWIFSQKKTNFCNPHFVQLRFGLRRVV